MEMVALIAESREGQELLAHSSKTLDEFGVAWKITSPAEVEISPARVLIVANLGAATLSHRVARRTDKPVLAAPAAAEGSPALDALRSTLTDGMDHLSLALGKAGAINAALLAVSILANQDQGLAEKLDAFRQNQTNKVLGDRLE